MGHIITLFHGSEKVVEEPTFGVGKKTNDFGLGFYCTESEGLAKEWAVSSLRDGFCNRYTLDTEYLNILNLNSPDYTILNWIAVLVEHRLFSIKTPVARRAKRYLIDNFGINVNAYDLIMGYRADDSYFDYTAALLTDSFSVGRQYCSRRVFDKNRRVFASVIAYSGILPCGYTSGNISNDRIGVHIDKI